MEEALVSSKLDAIGQEYNLLLAGQLEEQRRWFEGRHAQATTAHAAAQMLHSMAGWRCSEKHVRNVFGLATAACQPF